MLLPGSLLHSYICLTGFWHCSCTCALLLHVLDVLSCLDSCLYTLGLSYCALLQGNLSEFVKKKPEARSYYELKSAQGLKFILPEPGFLEGIKTKDRPILKMMKVAYQ